MQTLRQLADIPDERFRPQPQFGQPTTNWTTYVHARAFASTRSSDFKQLGANEVELGEKLAGLEERASSNRDVTASLTLVSIGRDRDENILITKSVFMGLFRRFGIDPRFLQLVKTNRYGLHYDWEGLRVSYYIGTALYILMWSFDRVTRKTRAILLSRDFINAEELGSLRRLLQLEADRMHSPFLLAWVSLVHLSNWMDSSTYYLLTTIRQLEELTGYGPYGKKKDGSEIPIDRLTQASKNIGYVQVNLANQLRHITIGTAISSHIATRAAKLMDYAVEPYVLRCQEELEEFNSTIPSLQRSLNDSSEYVYYLQERVRSQNTVVYALMTHADARINISLATASKELAEAAKKDSSSMKSIAIMTMLFLPGTYFAALWAVPSLKWGQPNVIQPDFWLYWVFTVPSTLLIFTVWFGLHKWGFRWRQLTRPGKNNNKYEALDGVSPPLTAPLEGYYGPPPPPATKPPAKYNAAPTSAPPMMNLGGLEMHGYSAPPELGDLFYPQTYNGDTSAPAAFIVPPNTDVRDYGLHPNP
ncbi:hypothetical protein E0Z10_g9922 [Xylaria hypoxylon]|uniref:Uncharacterized protein n=1 Tax=Xylaria hypoxylon TaxID=37992 RepID=A0A4Z0Y7B3_9PEZI|nr:hypothetical protein E0Z10_g9922 [Xylaria hypoxylon]